MSEQKRNGREHTENVRIMQKEPEGKTSGFIFLQKSIDEKSFSDYIEYRFNEYKLNKQQKINSVRIKIWQR